MGKNKDLSCEEKATITRELCKEKTTLPIARLLNRDHMTIRKFTDNPNQKRRRSDKGLFRAVDRPKLTSLKRSLSSKTLSTSRKVFEDAGVTLLIINSNY